MRPEVKIIFKIWPANKKVCPPLLYIINIKYNKYHFQFFFHLKTFSRKQTSAASTALGFLFDVFLRVQTTKAWLPDQIPDPYWIIQKKRRKEGRRERERG